MKNLFFLFLVVILSGCVASRETRIIFVRQTDVKPAASSSYEVIGEMNVPAYEINPAYGVNYVGDGYYYYSPYYIGSVYYRGFWARSGVRYYSKPTSLCGSTNRSSSYIDSRRNTQEGRYTAPSGNSRQGGSYSRTETMNQGRNTVGQIQRGSTSVGRNTVGQTGRNSSTARTTSGTTRSGGSTTRSGRGR